MKRIEWVCAGLLLTSIGCQNVWAETFPYHVEVEMQEIQEENLYMSQADIKVSGETDSKLEEALEHWEKERTENREADKLEYAEQAKAEREEKGEAFYGYVISEALEMTYMNENVLSFRESKYEYLGDDNMHSYVGGVNFDAQTGEILEISDVLTDAEGFKEAAIPFIVSYMTEMYGEYGISVTEAQIEQLWDSEMGWYMEASGITVAFEGSEFGVQIIQNAEIPLTLANLEKYMKTEYLKPNGIGIYKIRQNVPVQISVGENEETLLLSEEEMEYNWEYSINYGAENLEIGEYVFMRNAYYLQKEDGTQYLVIDLDMASDDYMTYLYKFTETSMAQTDVVDGGIDTGNLNLNSIKLVSWLDILGTYGAEKTYVIDENGKFVTDEVEYHLRGSVEDRFEIISTVELPFYIDGQETSLPAGTGLRMISTDGETYAVLQITESGQVGELPFIHGEGDDYWNLYIGEMNVNDCFEILPYVG